MNESLTYDQLWRVVSSFARFRTYLKLDRRPLFAQISKKFDRQTLEKLSSDQLIIFIDSISKLQYRSASMARSLMESVEKYFDSMISFYFLSKAAQEFHFETDFDLDAIDIVHWRDRKKPVVRCWSR